MAVEAKVVHEKHLITSMIDTLAKNAEKALGEFRHTTKRWLMKSSNKWLLLLFKIIRILQNWL
jgi:hypothetical protein